MQKAICSTFSTTKCSKPWIWAKRFLTKVTDSNGIRNIILNNPKNRNALSSDMLKTLNRQISEVAGKEDIRCVVLAAEGHVFCSGHDLKELTPDNADQHTSIFESCVSLMESISNLPVPVVAGVRGLAAAAGCQLVSMCDVVIAGENALFSTPGVNIGLFCSLPGVPLSRNIFPKTASYMLYTGKALTAPEALRAGLVSKVVADSQLEGAVEEVACSINGKSRAVLALGKKFFNAQLRMPLPVALRMGAETMVSNLLLEDAHQGIRGFFDKKR